MFIRHLDFFSEVPAQDFYPYSVSAGNIFKKKKKKKPSLDWGHEFSSQCQLLKVVLFGLLSAMPPGS